MSQIGRTKYFGTIKSSAFCPGHRLFPDIVMFMKIHWAWLRLIQWIPQIQSHFINFICGWFQSVARLRCGALRRWAGEVWDLGIKQHRPSLGDCRWSSRLCWICLRGPDWDLTFQTGIEMNWIVKKKHLKHPKNGYGFKLTNQRNQTMDSKPPTLTNKIQKMKVRIPASNGPTMAYS